MRRHFSKWKRARWLPDYCADAAWMGKTACSIRTSGGPTSTGSGRRTAFTAGWACAAGASWSRCTSGTGRRACCSSHRQDPAGKATKIHTIPYIPHNSSSYYGVRNGTPSGTPVNPEAKVPVPSKTDFGSMAFPGSDQFWFHIQYSSSYIYEITIVYMIWIAVVI